ncbi:MAG: lysoplasmalogenase family protein [Christensenellales bacterium]|jgi:uncharacterized membrane protein YhhN
MAYIALIAAALCAVLRCVQNKYIFSALTTLLCALAVAASGDAPAKLALILGLFLSIAADWQLAHQKPGGSRFLRGVIGFFIAHLLFLLYALPRYAYHLAPLIVSIALFAGYAVYLALRILPRAAKGLKKPIALYMLVSVASFYFALSMRAPAPERWLYIAGIAAILFSDTLIAEGDFAGNRKAQHLLLPAYYLCHILISLSAIIR